MINPHKAQILRVQFHVTVPISIATALVSRKRLLQRKKSEAKTTKQAQIARKGIYKEKVRKSSYVHLRFPIHTSHSLQTAAYTLKNAHSRATPPIKTPVQLKSAPNYKIRRRWRDFWHLRRRTGMRKWIQIATKARSAAMDRNKLRGELTKREEAEQEDDEAEWHGSWTCHVEYSTCWTSGACVRERNGYVTRTRGNAREVKKGPGVVRWERVRRERSSLGTSLVMDDVVSCGVFIHSCCFWGKDQLGLSGGLVGHRSPPAKGGEWRREWGPRHTTANLKKSWKMIGWFISLGTTWEVVIYDIKEEWVIQYSTTANSP